MFLINSGNIPLIRPDTLFLEPLRLWLLDQLQFFLLEQLDFSEIQSTGYSFFEEFLWRLKRVGARIVEVPIVFVDREYGQSKLNRAEAIHSLWMMFKFGVRNWLRLRWFWAKMGVQPVSGCA